MTFTLNLVIIVSGFYLAFRVSSLRSAAIVAVGIGAALSILAALAPHDRATGLFTIIASRLLGAFLVYLPANRFDGILAFLMIVPLGVLLLLAGGPIELAQTLMEKS